MVKILVIDDSSFQRKIISGILTENGHQVIQAVNGKDGIEQVEKEEPDLILTDLLMPEYDGHWVIDQLNARKSTIPVIIITSDIQKTTEKRCREHGVVAFLNKPVDKNQVISSIETVLKRS